MQTRRLFPALVAALALAAAAPPASAQVVDSLEVEILAFPSAIFLEGPPRVSTSSQVTYRLAVDPPDAAAHIIWTVQDGAGAPADSSLAYFVSWTDSSAVIQIGDAPGAFRVRAEAVPLDSIIVGRLEGDRLDFDEPLELEVGETAQFCAYGFSGDRALWAHPGPACHSAPWPAAGTGLHQRVAVLRPHVPLPPDDPAGAPMWTAVHVLPGVS